MTSTLYGKHLPIFPNLGLDLGINLTELQVARAVERMMDRADAALMNGYATQEQYDAWVKRLNEWEWDGIDQAPSPD